MKFKSPPPGPLEPPTKAALVITYGFIAATVLYIGGTVLLSEYYSAFFCLPFFVGFIVGVFSERHPWRNALITLLVSILVAVAIMREGVVCMLFGLPFLVLVMAPGVYAGHIMRRRARTQKARSTAALVALLTGLGWQAVSGRLYRPADAPWHQVISSRDLAATPAEVFARLTHPIEVQGPWPWVIRLGLPIPRRMAVETPGLGGRVRMDFNHGSAFARITDWRPGEALAFQMERYAIEDPPFFITRLGRAEHYGLKTERVDDWLTFGEIRYDLAPAPGGGTRLTRSTRFQRHLYPGFYFGTMQEVIIGLGQARLLERLSEGAEASGRISSVRQLPGSGSATGSVQ